MPRMVNGRDFDGMFTENVIVIGQCAFQRCGLTSYLSNIVQVSTLIADISKCNNGYVTYYLNPWALDTSFTNPSSAHSYVLEPTRERAIVEYMFFHDYFDEGILIEGINTYGLLNKGDFSKLYPVADHFGIDHAIVDYWINEALNDEEV